jgi:hypothetical protein
MKRTPRAMRAGVFKRAVVGNLIAANLLSIYIPLSVGMGAGPTYSNSIEQEVAKTKKREDNLFQIIFCTRKKEASL